MKKAKFLVFLLAAGMAAGGFVPLNQIQTQAQTLDSVDRQLVDFIKDDLGTDEKIRFSHTPLFDETLTESGREYSFAVGNRSGYALMKAFTIGENTVYEIEELFYGKASPFENCDGLPVYVAHNTYLAYQDEAFYDLASETELTEESVAAIAADGFGYQGSIGTFEDQTQTISYATKDTSVAYSIPYDLPNYGTETDTSSCANTAGTVLIGYYDRFYEELIPNFQTYTTMGSVVIYRTATAEIANVADELHTLMGTDSSYQGTTFAGFQAGMEAYVEDKGLTYTTTSVLTSGAFDFTKYKNAVEAQKPVALFMSGFAFLGSITTAEGVDTITNSYNANGTHVVVGCGYQRHTYYNASGSVISTRTYLKVATGLTFYDIGYLNINGFGNIDKAIAVQIG